jgi:iron complex outermembrane receptor protein
MTANDKTPRQRRTALLGLMTSASALALSFAAPHAWAQDAMPLPPAQATEPVSQSAQQPAISPDAARRSSRLPNVVVTEPHKRSRTQRASEDRRPEGRAARRPQRAAARRAPPADGGNSAAASRPLDGSAAAGYRVGESTASGPIWGDLPVQDAPYSLTVIPSQLIENLQAWQPEDLVKVVPQITNVTPIQNLNGNPFFTIRGFKTSQFTNGAGVTYDGLQGGVGGALANTLEDKERVEVLSGVSGFLYGIGGVGGNINYVLKRPTATPYYSLTGGNNAGANGFVHGDFGGPITDTPFGYRLNVVGQDGDTSLSNQSIKRNLVSGTFDVHLPWDALLQFNAAHSDYNVYGQTTGFVPSTNPFPSPPNGVTSAAPPWSQFHDITDTVGTKLTWKLNDIFTLRAAWDATRENRERQDDFLIFIDDQNNLSGRASNGTNSSIWYTNSKYMFLDAAFSTFGIQHKLTTGFTGYESSAGFGGNGLAPYSVTYSNLGTVSNPIVPVQPIATGIPNTTPQQTYGHNFARNWIIGDEIKITDKLILLAGANFATIGSSNSIVPSLGYEASKVTPTASLVYKIAPWLTTYATYQQSLQQGVSVLNTAFQTFTNNGAVLPPYVGNQYEVGVKAEVAKNMLLTLALFDIDKANQYQVNNGDGTWTYLQSGREVHKGVEFTAAGKLTDDLTLIGGVTAMDARVTKDETRPNGNGSIPSQVAPYSAKLYAEYNIPFWASAPFLHNLTLNGGFQYVSYSYIDYPNTLKQPGYGTFNVGFRYETELDGHPLIVRFNVNNVADRSYWAGYYVGAPRTFLASAQIKW